MIRCLSGSCGSLPRPSIISKSRTTYVYPGTRSKFKERFLLNEYCSHTIVMLKNLNHLKLGVVCTITVHSSVLSHIWNVVYKARIHRVAPLPLPSASESKRIATRGHCWFYTTILVYNCLRGGIFREVSLWLICIIGPRIMPPGVLVKPLHRASSVFAGIWAPLMLF